MIGKMIEWFKGTVCYTSLTHPTELELQEKRYDFIRLQRGAVAKALPQGLQDGKQKATQEIAKRLIQAGFDVLTINLTEAEVRSLIF